MKSPFTGGETILKSERREIVFRKETFSYIAQFYECVDTKEQFTTTELDEVNIGQVYNQYRVKYGIPFPDEIKGIRELYGLSAAKMSEILGFGANQYRLYENGEMPSEAVGKTLGSIMESEVFMLYVKSSRYQLSEAEYEKIHAKLNNVINRDFEANRAALRFNCEKRSSLNGYAPQSYEKIKNVILFYIKELGSIFSTKMNKLLFYTDFYSYKTRGVGITGLAYRAIQFGPVPIKWNVLYSLIEGVETEIVPFNNGNAGERLLTSEHANLSALTSKELEILNTIIEKFANCTSTEISAISHKEDAWINYYGKSQAIDYSEAFTLRAL